jgi:hypothetical protein
LLHRPQDKVDPRLPDHLGRAEILGYGNAEQCQRNRAFNSHGVYSDRGAAGKRSALVEIGFV